MANSSILRYRDAKAIYQLIGECRELGDDRIRWRDHLIEGLAAMTGADIGHAGEMAGCRSLTPRDLGVVVWGWQTGFAEMAAIEAGLREFEHDPTMSPAMIEHLRRHVAEDGICLSRSQILEDRPWYVSADYQAIQRPFRVDHILWCFRTIPGAGDDEASGIVLNRQKGRRDFGARDIAIVQETNASLASLLGGPLARFKDPSPLDLAPRIRQTLACVLEGDSDKQIATRMTLSTHTVNQYTKAIYAHFGVNGRAELMARWIRRGWGGTLHWSESNARDAQAR
ncbi:helix-turn-helix transcriptional regulator [Isosphaeraceae bacterium EP7]